MCFHQSHGMNAYWKEAQLKSHSFSDISQDNDACVVMKSYSTFVVLAVV